MTVITPIELDRDGTNLIDYSMDHSADDDLFWMTGERHAPAS